MAQPTHSDVHVDAALTDMSIAYIQAAENFVAGRVFASKPVQHRTDKYHVFSKNDWNRDDAVVKRSQGQKAPRSGFTLSTDSYDADAWWTAVPMSELTRANADPAVPLDQAAMRLVTQRMLIRRERQFVTDYIALSKWGTDVVGGTDFTRWDDAASDPEKDILTAKEVVLKNTGMMPNRLVLPFQAHNALKRHPLIKDRTKYTSSESITEAVLARFFEVDDYIVAKSSYATNAEGATAAYDFAFPKSALLFYFNGDPSIMTPTAATNFVWSGLTGLNDLGVRIDQFYDPDAKEDVVRGEFAFDMKITGSDLGYFFSGCVS